MDVLRSSYGITAAQDVPWWGIEFDRNLQFVEPQCIASKLLVPTGMQNLSEAKFI